MMQCWWVCECRAIWTIFRQVSPLVTIFRHLFLISCIFFIFHRNRFLSLCRWNTNKFWRSGFKQLTKICFSTLRILMVNVAKYGSISPYDVYTAHHYHIKYNCMPGWRYILIYALKGFLFIFMHVCDICCFCDIYAIFYSALHACDIFAI